VFLPRFEIAGSVAFKTGVISVQTILEDSIGTGRKIWEEDAGVVTALPPDDFAAGESVNVPQAGEFRQATVNPVRLQGRMAG
jgi:hypothetical protein